MKTNLTQRPLFRIENKYILDGKNIRRLDLGSTKELMEWGKWIGNADRHVANTELDKKDMRISTVFLGLDYNFAETGPPILFETMVFEGQFDGEMNRYCTWAEAEDGHQEMLKKVMGSIAPQN